MAHNRHHRQIAADRNSIGGHRIARPTQRCFDAVGDQHHGLVGPRLSCRLSQNDVYEMLRSDHRPPSARMLSTSTPRNNADGQPWLTGAT